MAEQSLLLGDRTWFHDARTPVRRMAVSAHAEQGLVVISFWRADMCVATFRLPLHEASRLIGSLADAMAE